MFFYVIQSEEIYISARLDSQQYLLVSMVIRVYVVVKFLVFSVLLITKLTVEISSQVFQSLCNGLLFFHLVLFLMRNTKGNKLIN